MTVEWSVYLHLKLINQVSFKMTYYTLDRFKEDDVHIIIHIIIMDNKEGCRKTCSWFLVFPILSNQHDWMIVYCFTSDSRIYWFMYWFFYDWNVTLAGEKTNKWSLVLDGYSYLVGRNQHETTIAVPCEHVICVLI